MDNSFNLNVDVDNKQKSVRLWTVIKDIESGGRDQGDFNESDGVPSIGGEHINNDGTLSLEEIRYISIPFYQKMNKGHIKEGDILVVKDGIVGKAAFVESKPFNNCAVNEHVFIIRTNEENFTKFIYYLIKSQKVQDQIWKCAKGSVQLGINTDFIKNVIVNLPPYSEQIKVSKYLDIKIAQIKSYIENRRKIINCLNEHKQSIIIEAVCRGLNNNVEFISSGIEWLGTIPSHWKILRCKYLFREIIEKSTTGQEVHLSMSQKHGLVPSSMISEKRLQSESYTGGKLCKKNDLVLNRLKAHLGVFAIAEQDGVISPDYSVFRAIKPLDMYYYEKLLKTSNFRTELRKRAKGIVEGFWRLYTDDFYNIRLPVPPKEEQKDINSHLCSKLSVITKLIDDIDKEITLLNELQNRIILNKVTKKNKGISFIYEGEKDIVTN